MKVVASLFVEAEFDSAAHDGEVSREAFLAAALDEVPSGPPRGEAIPRALRGVLMVGGMAAWPAEIGQELACAARRRRARAVS